MERCYCTIRFRKREHDGHDVIGTESTLISYNTSTRAYIYTHAYTHKYIYTHTHTHTHTLVRSKMRLEMEGLDKGV